MTKCLEFKKFIYLMIVSIFDVLLECQNSYERVNLALQENNVFRKTCKRGMLIKNKQFM